MRKIYRTSWFLSWRCLHDFSLQFSICPTKTLHLPYTNVSLPLLKSLGSVILPSVFVSCLSRSHINAGIYSCVIGLLNMAEHCHPRWTMCQSLRWKNLNCCVACAISPILLMDLSQASTSWLGQSWHQGHSCTDFCMSLCFQLFICQMHTDTHINAAPGDRGY